MAYENDLDLTFYRKAYSDLSEFSDSQLQKHWLDFGKKEGRAPNKEEFLKKAFNFNLDLDFYLLRYPDLVHEGIQTINEAKLHWLRYGKGEKRFRTVEEWERQTGLRFFCCPPNLDIEAVVEKNKSLDITPWDLFETFVGNIAKPISFFDYPMSDAQFYQKLGVLIFKEFSECKSRAAGLRENISAADKDLFFKQIERGRELLLAARSSWKCSLHFYSNPEVLELLGDSFFGEAEFGNAKSYYEESSKITGESSQALMERIDTCYENTKVLSVQFEALIEQLDEDPSLTHLEDELDECFQGVFQSSQASFEINVLNDDRELLVDRFYELSERIYSAWFNVFGDGNHQRKESLNTDRILIIGDYSIAQCFRYRIEQKVEQLESQGKIVTAFDWRQIGHNWNLIAQHDVVIFYRLQAFPAILKAMAMLNANGKATFYEIDDLLIEPSYPEDIDTYGGYVDLNTYHSLVKSMAAYRAAARHCRFGMASTLPLCDKLKELVLDSECILHRNGLDSKSVFELSPRVEKSSIDIFYGSGTQAHNSDFTEQALPALRRVLKKYPHVRLIVAGYLNLPQAFLSEFEYQLLRIPPVNKIEAYWAFLEQGDINLAVLHDNMLNGSKSEIKWLEAACFGIPSIVSSTENYRDVLQDGENVLFASNEEQWFVALEALIRDKQVRERIGKSALSKAQSDYSIENLGKSLVNELDKVLVTPESKSRKKVAIVNVFFPPQAVGGATRVVVDNLDVLKQHYGEEFEVVLFASDAANRAPHKISVYQHNGRTVYRATVLEKNNNNWQFQDEGMGELFKQFIECEKPDLIHFHCLQRLTASVVQAAKDQAVPYIVTVHDAWWISDYQFLMDAQNNVYEEGHPNILEPKTLPPNISLGDSVARLLFLKELLLGAKAVLSVSEGFANIYKKNGFQDIRVNKNGLGSSIEWKPKNTAYTDKIVCGHIGGLSNHKGYFLMKAAIENLQPNNIEMLIVDHSKGPGYILESKWGDVPVTFIGRVNQDDIVSLYQKIDVLLAPSIWPESFGLVAREAAACGCWVVASDKGGIGEDVIPGETGFVISPNSTELEATLASINDDTEKYKGLSLVRNVRTVKNQVAELVEIYHEQS